MADGCRSRATIRSSLLVISMCAGCTLLQPITPEPEDSPVSRSPSSIEWGEPTDGWRLSLSLERATYVPDGPIIATIRFQNLSDQERQLGGNGRDFDHDFSCTTGEGVPVPLTSYGKLMVENRGLGKATGGALPPMGETVVQVPISRHLDISLPGRYRLSASRQVFANEDPMAPHVVSNTVEFTLSQ